MSSSSIEVLSIGSGVLDVLLKSSKFAVTPVDDQLMVCELYGGKMDVEDSLVTSGGAGTNTAVSFRRQGFGVACLACIGKDIAAQVVVDDLLKEKVVTTFLVTRANLSTGISAILVAKDGSRSAVTYRGASHELQVKDLDLDRFQALKAIHLSSVGSLDVVREVMRYCFTHHIFLSWNPSETEAEEFFLRGETNGMACDALYVNDLEWKGIQKNENKVRSSTKMLIITRGKLGGEIITKEKTFLYEAKRDIPVVDETGAGDAFASGLTGGVLRGLPLEQAVTFATENAAGVVGQMGAKAGLITVP